MRNHPKIDYLVAATVPLQQEEILWLKILPGSTVKWAETIRSKGFGGSTLF